MKLYCKYCGAKLDEMTGLCPYCDADVLYDEFEDGNLQIYEKYETLEPPKTKRERTAGSEKYISRRDAKKQRKPDKKVSRKRGSVTFGHKICKIMLSLFLWLVVAAIAAFGVIGGLSYFHMIDIPMVTAFREGKLLEVINERNMIIEETDIEMISDTEGTATIVVKMPNYEQLFQEAAEADNPEQYLIMALALKRYEVQKMEATASVTIENGKTTIHTDDTVHKLLEEALVNAINGLSEEER